MKPDVKQAWLTALRSGDYQQGQRYLRQGDQYCCLGVLCDLYGKAVGPEWSEPPEDDSDQVRLMLDHYATLPLKVQEWADLVDPNPLDLDALNRLIALNDDGSTFEELANIIEEGL